MVGKLLTAVFFIALARILLPERFGEVTYFITIIQLVNAIFDLGIRQFFQKKMVTDAHAWLFTQVTYLRLLLYILSFVVLAALTFIFRGSLPPLGWLSLCLLAEALFSVADAHYLSIGKSIRLGQKLIARNVLIFGYLLLIYSSPAFLSLNYFYLFYTVSIFIVLIFYFPYCQLKFAELNIRSAKIKHLIKKTFNYGLMDSSSVIYSKGDGLVIQNVLGDAALGIYGGAYRFVDGLNLLPQALFHNLFSISSKKNAVSKQQLKKMVTIMGAIGALAGGALIALSNPLIIILIGESFSAAIPVLRIFGVMVFLFFLNSPLNILIQSSNLLKKYLPWIVSLVAINLALTIGAILIFRSIEMAAYVKIVTEIMTIVVNLHFIRKLKLK